MTYKDHFVTVNDIRLHYIEYAGKGPTILLLHGLTANAHVFAGLIAAGLAEDYHIISLDMRGRGESARPAYRYTVEDHAADIIALLDHLNIDKIILCGHSFGGLLSLFLANTQASRVEKIIVLDAAAEMNPNTLEMLGDALSRLDAKYPSWDKYIETMKSSVYNTFWDPAMLEFYKADVMPTASGGVTPIPSLADMMQVSLGVGSLDWKTIVAGVRQPAILCNGLDIYTLGEPLLPDFKAKETVELMANCKYIGIDGNHQTMLFGPGAMQIVHGIKKFV